MLFEKEESVTKSIEVPTTIIIAIVISTISIALPRFLLYRLLNLSIFFNNVSIIDLLPSIVLFYFSRLIFATALSRVFVSCSYYNIISFILRCRFRTSNVVRLDYSFRMYVIVIVNVPETSFPSGVIERCTRLYDFTRAIASVTL